MRPVNVLAIFPMFIAAALAQTPQAVTDLAGRIVDPLNTGDRTRVTVLVFTRSDCPVANQMAPEIARVHEQFAGRAVRVWLIYLDPGESADQIRKHRHEYRLRVETLRDPGHRLVERAGVRVTPEAAVYLHDSPTPRLVYRGRIDNRVISPGRHRLRPTTFDLRDAVEAALDGTVEPTTTPAFGCEIADLRDR